MTCTKCRGSGLVLARPDSVANNEGLVDVFSRVALCECMVGCGRCGGERGILVTDNQGYELVQPCPRCSKAIHQRRLWNSANVPAGLQHATLDNYHPQTDEQHVALQEAREFLASFRPGRKGRMFAGPTGTGKTHLVTALIRELTKASVRCLFVRTRDVLAGLKDRYAREQQGDAVRATEYRAHLIRVTVLILDELSELRTDWQRESIGDLVESRYNANATTLITTNYDDEEIPNIFGEGGRRVTSRLLEMAPVVVVFGPDHRDRRAS